MSKEKYIVGCKWLAIYQIVGGCLGIVSMLYLFFPLSSLEYLAVFIFIGILLHSFSVYCGIVLLQSQSNSLLLSFVCQLLQSVSVQGFGFSYKYVSGILFSLVLDSSETFHIHFDISLWSFSLGISDVFSDRIIGFNIVALGIMMFLYYQIKEINIEKKRDLIDSIGNEPQMTQE